jgi:hypothetical protein
MRTTQADVHREIFKSNFQLCFEVLIVSKRVQKKYLKKNRTSNGWGWGGKKTDSQVPGGTPFLQRTAGPTWPPL